MLIAKEGYPFIIIGILVTVISVLFGWGWLAFILAGATVFTIWFFRDPERATPGDEADIISPADGRVVEVGEFQDNRYLKEKVLKISIFMSVFNVHVNRAPVSGVVKKITYNVGKFLLGHLPTATLQNEQNAVLIETPAEKRVLTVQVAGLVARRIVCNVREGYEVKRGNRFGMIRFGSRLDVYIPLGSEIKVSKGEKVHAGESIIGRFQ